MGWQKSYQKRLNDRLREAKRNGQFNHDVHDAINLLKEEENAS